MSCSWKILLPSLKLSNCREERSFLDFFKPTDQTMFAFRASLGSALSTIIELKENTPIPESFSSSHFL